VSVQHLTPVSDHVLDLQYAAHSAVPSHLLRERHRLVAIMVLTSVFNRHAPFGESFDAALIENALDMATAALTAPIAKSVRAMLKKAGRSDAGP
jgi:hypothetical protein